MPQGVNSSQAPHGDTLPRAGPEGGEHGLKISLAGAPLRNSVDGWPTGEHGWRRFRGAMSNSHLLGWIDQAVVSATNFVPLVVIGRATTLGELGRFSIGFSVLALALAAQDSLVTRPYSIQWHRPKGTPGEHAFSVLISSVLLAIVVTLALSVTALTLLVAGMQQEFLALTWAIAAVAPFVLGREFARRFAFARLHVAQAIIVDLVTGLFVVATLGALAWTGLLSAVTALLSVGVSCALAVLVWLWLARRELTPGVRHFVPTLKQSWEIGKWLLSGQLAVQVQGYMTGWLTFILAGATMTGIFTACASIVGFANPILYGFYNILTPKFVHALNTEGVPTLRRLAARDALFIAAVMSAFCGAVSVFGDDVLRLLYRSDAYQESAYVLGVLAVASLAGAIGVPASLALAAADRARSVAGVMTATAVLNLLFVTALLPVWGLLGAACGMLIAEISGSIARWAVFLCLVSRNTNATTSPY